MCGIAGIIDLTGKRQPEQAVVRRMADALLHRGPDEDGYLFRPGIGFANRRLSIVGLGDGSQPIFNEDGSVGVVYNGELFNYPEVKAELEAKGHVFRTHTDTEIIVHLYEEYGEDVFSHLKGQFAVALIDFTKRTVFLGRDRVGICPLHWSRQGDWMYFGSEIKAILASGEVQPRFDPRGMDQVFTFFAQGTQRTMFEGIQSVLPGHYLKIAFRADGKSAEVVERRYWDIDFPDAGDEVDAADPTALIDQFEALFQRSVSMRLRADVPVVGYLSGGVDSAYVLATASKLRGSPIPSFTIQVPGKGLDETSDALFTARALGSQPTILRSDSTVIANTYPKLIASTDSPVIDTSCAALWRLAQEVHDQGYKVALTGEGSDEAFAGYIWFKLRKLSYFMDVGGTHVSDAVNRMFRIGMAPHMSNAQLKRIDEKMGRAHAQTLIYHLVSQSRAKYFSGDVKAKLGDYTAYDDVHIDTERMRRWDPLNQSLYYGYKVHLPGLLLNHKGDRVAMANSVETRYPFLDEDVVEFVSKLSPRWKLRGMLKDKHFLRLAASRVLPEESAFRKKGMFRAPLAESFFINPPDYVRQLMSRESLNRTGYFDTDAVLRDYEAIGAGKGNKINVFLKMGLTGVLSTQLWHQIYMGGGLCELPDNVPKPQVDRPEGVGLRKAAA
ncbi:Asparagine synthetase [glutamine-hydrolyzing] [Hyphomicrobium sulfonivorans]|uniref:asparagine synthase (glutamine-hydrolyzing) n=1 Tax=Hyphomicrobium sulfonivorans TaxID=121290 RepID=A0A109BCW6_HYPSL|nr:asparagine synthase (glutamine-hydrolyzing) [Hyphomicrobium sulfonivorans]KWT66260.1 Asparagine synthetase [glutamine-hydrolyzing] [Hyphomicrobium sulfonivorans]